MTDAKKLLRISWPIGTAMPKRLFRSSIAASMVPGAVVVA